MTEQPGGASIGAPDVGLYLDDEQAVAAVSHPIAPGPSLHLASLHSTVLNTHPDGTVSLGDATDNDSEAYTHFLDARSGFPGADHEVDRERLAHHDLCRVGAVGEGVARRFDALAACLLVEQIGQRLHLG